MKLWMALNNVLKRLFDILLSLTALVILSPVMILCALWIKFDSQGPVIFKQDRLTKNGRVFKMFKFRSMVQNAEKTGAGLFNYENDPRVTRSGHFLREHSLDELPQLINIIKGDMSFLGPRPPLTYHPWTYDRYTKEQLRMFEVRPGISGWAQVNGRRCVEWNERIKMNVWYVDHVSFLLDLKIVFLSVVRVFSNADNKNIGATVTQAPKSPSEL